MIYDFAKNVFPSLLKAGEKINIYRIYSYWSDIGTIDQYIQSNKDALNRKVMIKSPDIMRKYDAVYCVGDNCDIDESVKFLNNIVIGNNCKIGKNVVLNNVIIWDNTEISDNVKLNNIVAANNCIIKSSLNDEILGPDRVIELDLVKQ